MKLLKVDPKSKKSRFIALAIILFVLFAGFAVFAVLNTKQLVDSSIEGEEIRAQTLDIIGLENGALEADDDNSVAKQPAPGEGSQEKVDQLKELIETANSAEEKRIVAQSLVAECVKIGDAQCANQYSELAQLEPIAYLMDQLELASQAKNATEFDSLVSQVEDQLQQDAEFSENFKTNIRDAIKVMDWRNDISEEDFQT